MNNDELLEKIVNNKYLLYFIPNLLYISKLMGYYNYNYSDVLILLIWDVLICIFMLFIISNIIYVILKKTLIDNKKIYALMIPISIALASPMPIYVTIIFFIYMIFVIILIKKINKFNPKNIIAISFFVCIAYFSINLVSFIPKATEYLFNSKSASNAVNVQVNKDLPSPNIYWIHCDAMMNFEVMKKYFKDEKQVLKAYLDENNYITNEDAILISGQKTPLALAALLNPNYYDNFYNQYLQELQNHKTTGQKTSFSIQYTEIINKRLNNELMNSLKEKGYTTISITRMDEFSSLHTDIIYDYYTGENNRELRQIKKSSREDIILLSNYNRLNEKILLYTIFNPIAKPRIHLDYNRIDYTNLNLENYAYINKTDYWPAKAIIKGIEDSSKIEKSKFFFIDYFLNHTPITYDENGNLLQSKDVSNIDCYLGNYIYSSYLLIDMLNYIKNNDKDAVIILQGDHGLHTVSSEMLESYFNIDTEEAQKIKNSVINSVYIPEKYKTTEEESLKNPLNISRYLVNNYVGETYQYLDME